MVKSYSPENELIVQVMPNPMRKVRSGPENMPAIAVEAYPFFAKAVIDK
jgi:hypothetical protein